MMRFASLAGLLVLFGGIVHAAEGDSLMVTGNGVNVRASPKSEAPVLQQAHRAEPAVELAREGGWVRVRLPERDIEGWIHGSLLAAAGGAGTNANQNASPKLAAVGVPIDALAGFRQSIEYLNTRALAAAGVDLFADVRMAGDDVVQIVATDAWEVVPETGRQSYLNALADRWSATVGSPLSRLQIVDESGRVLSERAGP
jgi:Bacterial SH3 domain